MTDEKSTKDGGQSKAIDRWDALRSHFGPKRAAKVAEMVPATLWVSLCKEFGADHASKAIAVTEEWYPGFRSVINRRALLRAAAKRLKREAEANSGAASRFCDPYDSSGVAACSDVAMASCQAAA